MYKSARWEEAYPSTEISGIIFITCNINTHDMIWDALVSNKRYTFEVKCWQTNGYFCLKVFCSRYPIFTDLQIKSLFTRIHSISHKVDNIFIIHEIHNSLIHEHAVRQCLLKEVTILAFTDNSSKSATFWERSLVFRSAVFKHASINSKTIVFSPALFLIPVCNWSTWFC